MKKVMAFLIAAAMALGCAGCAGGDTQKTTTAQTMTAGTASAQADNSQAQSEDNTSAKETKIGIIQYGSHPSLDNCYNGVYSALVTGYDLGKVSLDHQIGNFDSQTCDTIAKNMVAKNYDIIIAIATPAAVSAYAATANSDVPVIFCAVSDPVAAGLVDSLEKPNGDCTGTSDILDLNSQVELIKTLQPDVEKIGVLYTTSEANSVSQLAKLKEITEPLGIEVVAQGVQTAADIPQAAASLCAQVDCVNNFTDNNVVGNLSVLLEQSNAAGIPVYGSEIEQVINGCMASISIDYVKLGQVTGEMAVRVLKGENPGDIPVGQITEGTPVVNTDVLAAFEIELPEAYADAEKVVTAEAEE